MQELINSLDINVVAVILVGIGGYTIQRIVDFIKTKVAIQGALVLLATALVSCAFTAVYLAIFVGFTLPVFAGYSVLVFACSIVEYETIKSILEVFQNR